MTGAKKPTIGKKGIKKLKLKKETIRDLDAKSKGKDVKGGAANATDSCFPGRTCVACR